MAGSWVTRQPPGDALQGAVAVDGALATSAAQAAAFWQIREGLVEAQARLGRHLRTDVSIPISALALSLETTQTAPAAAPECLALAYGHLGDGNIHSNVLPPTGLNAAKHEAVLHGCEEIIFAQVDRNGGSISAEHGIGRVKRRAFLERTPALDLALLCGVRSAIDSAGVMSPGRIFD